MGGEETEVLSVYREMKNCPRYWKVPLSGPRLNESSDSLFGAQ